MKNTIIIILFYFLAACSGRKINPKNDFIVANGQMPNVTKDNDNNLHLVYGIGDSLMYSYSSDNASTFSESSLISVLPEAYSFAMRGPQVATTGNGIVVTASTSLGDIFSFYKEGTGNWEKGRRVNDVDTIAKEGFTALSADGGNAYAVWLDVRGNNKNKIYGASSKDGGKTWSANQMIYTSPDTTVCECCKPSVILKAKNVYVMFRNWLNGNRDLYLIQSTDGGNTFGQAQKLGTGHWKLNGCPMDGGSLVVNRDLEVQTVWRREGKLYTAQPGMPEKEIGEGKGCTIETINNKNIYAWSEKGEIVIINPEGQKKMLGRGSLPVLKALDDDHVICVWEYEKQVHASIVEF